MTEREAAALDAYRLLPRLLRGLAQVDSQTELAGMAMRTPMLPLHAAPPEQPTLQPAMIPAELLLSQPHLYHPEACVALVPNDKMSVLIRTVKELGRLGVAAAALDQGMLAETAPFGTNEWRPRIREELAELRAAADVPFWLYGVGCADDAEAALEAGLEGVVVHSSAGRHVAGPAVIEILPEILDAVAGTIGVYAAGLVRSGIDVFRLLAVGADAVIVEGDRGLAGLEAELHYAMRITGCESLSEIGLDTIFAPLFEDGP